MPFLTPPMTFSGFEPWTSWQAQRPYRKWVLNDSSNPTNIGRQTALDASIYILVCMLKHGQSKRVQITAAQVVNVALLFHFAVSLCCSTLLCIQCRTIQNCIYLINLQLTFEHEYFILSKHNLLRQATVPLVYLPVFFTCYISYKWLQP